MAFPEDISIASLQEAYKSGAATPTQVVEALYERIESCPDKAVWIEVTPKEDALKAASELEKKYGGSASKPPLYGIPFSVKNSIDVAGFLTTCALPTFAYKATKTAFCVQLCLDAGAILLGTTNLDQCATGLNGTRSPYGMPRCVFDDEYISGGSSSGSAVSVGRDLVTFSIGTDTAGSTRIPSSLNGLIGLKPSLYSISTEGLIPACKTADCICIITKALPDAGKVLDVMQVYDPEDIYAREAAPARAPFPSSLTSIKYGTPPSELLSVLVPEYAELYEAALAKVDKMGLQKDNAFDYSAFESANNMLYGASIVAQRVVAFKDYIDKHGMDSMLPVIKEIYATSAEYDCVRAWQDIFELQGYKRQVDNEFKGKIDVLIVPSTVRHWKVSEMLEEPLGRNKLLGSFSHFANLTDLCAVAIPAGKWTNANGNQLPFSITLIAPAGRDRDLLKLAEAFIAA